MNDRPSQTMIRPEPVMSVLYDALRIYQQAKDEPSDVGVGMLDRRLSAIYLAVEHAVLEQQL